MVVGTRPGIIKMSPIIRVLQNQNLDFFLMHTGQHYSYEMDAQFFGDLALPVPAHKLSNVRDFRTHGGQTAEMLKGVDLGLEQVPGGEGASSDGSGSCAAPHER